MKEYITHNRVSKRGNGYYSDLTGRTYSTREAAVAAERRRRNQ